MIPTAVKGHMPFLSTAHRRTSDTSSSVKPRLPNGLNHQENGNNSQVSGGKPKSPLNQNGLADHPQLCAINGKAKPPTSLILTNGYHLSPPNSCSMNPGSKKNRSPTTERSRLSPTPNFSLDSPNGCLHLSPAKREDILHKDHHWRDFLKALFKTKLGGKKSSESKTRSDVNENHVPIATKTKTINIKHPLANKRIKYRSKPKRSDQSKLSVESTSSIPLQRSHSMNATHKNLARLEAIIEEELDIEAAEEITALSIAYSAPSTINRIRPNSEHLERKAVLKYLRKQTPVSPLEQLWTDSDSSCESLQDIDPLETLS